MSWSGTVRCSHCWKTGHNRRSCPKLEKRMRERLEEDADDWYAKQYFAKKTASKGKKKSCGYCSYLGHTRRTCKELKHAKETALSLCAAWRKKLVEGLKKQGIGIGTLVKYTRWEHEEVGMVMAIRWSVLDHRIEFDATSGGGHPFALEVCEVGNLSRHERRPLRIPAMAGVIPVENSWSQKQNVEVVSPITAKEVEATIPEDFYQGRGCLIDIFNEHKKPDYRTVPYQIEKWCPLQGFYTEGV